MKNKKRLTVIIALMLLLTGLIMIGVFADDKANTPPAQMCPLCSDVEMDLYCGGADAGDGMFWNAYVCPQCMFFERSNISDRELACHAEEDCALPRLKELITSNESDEQSGAQTKDPVAAADYCEVHEIFACDIPHNDVE